MQFKQILLITCLLINAVCGFAQQKRQKPGADYKSFSKLAAQANVAFYLPEGFKEVTEKQPGFTFDYGMTLPGQDFEVWFKIIPQRNVERSAVSDSAFVEIANVEARSLAGDENYFMRDMHERGLGEYNADAGRTYLINLPDVALTKHYKYALLISIQKKRAGTVLAVCLTNDKGPDFFKNLIKARGCLKFKT